MIKVKDKLLSYFLKMHVQIGVYYADTLPVSQGWEFAHRFSEQIAIFL